MSKTEFKERLWAIIRAEGIEVTRQYVCMLNAELKREL